MKYTAHFEYTVSPALRTELVMFWLESLGRLLVTEFQGKLIICAKEKTLEGFFCLRCGKILKIFYISANGLSSFPIAE